MTNSNNTMNGMFSNNGATATNGANQLEKTAQLTATASEIVNSIMVQVATDSEQYKEAVAESMKSHNAMDKLIADCYNLSIVNIDFLEAEGNEVLEKMLRSQQSKRSRSKSKVMTVDNYKSMLNGAVAENLLRLATGKPKTGSTGSYKLSDATYSDDELEALSNDLEALKKAIRNVQSKKSIAKSKADYDESSDRWQQLLLAEEQLKALRSTGVDSQASKAVEVNHKVEELLASVDVSSLKSADAKATLEAIKEMLASK